MARYLPTSSQEVITSTEKQETNDMNSSAKIATYLGPNHSGDSTLVDSSSDGDGDTGLTNNQGKLLYLIHLHTAKAKDRDSKDRWLRKQSLNVLIYEGVVSELFDYDYRKVRVSIVSLYESVCFQLKSRRLGCFI